MLPLTTVRMPFYELGRRAAELVLAQLRGEEVPEVVTMPTELIVRRSCGCFSQAVTADGARADRDRYPKSARWVSPSGGHRGPTGAHHHPDEAAMGMSTAELAPDWADRLLTAFISDVQGESADAFLIGAG